MATKKTDNLFDEDFNFDDDIFGEMSPMDSTGGSTHKKRKGPVRQFVSQFGVGAKDRLLSPSLIKKLAIEILPKGYGSVIELAGSMLETTRQLYDDAANELKPAMPGLRAAVGKVQGALEGKTPGKINDILKDFATQEETYRAPTQAEIDDQSIGVEITKIFEATNKQTAKRSAADRAERLLRQRVEDVQQRDLLQLLTAQGGSLNRLVGYQDKVTHPWRQKTLELQYRQTFYARDLLSTQREMMGLMRDGFKDLVFNTSLPDYKKTDPDRRTDGSIRNRLGASSNPATRFISGLGNRVKRNLSEKAKGLASGLGMGADQIASMQDAIEGVDEDMSPGGRLGMVANLLGQSAAEWGATKLARIPKRLMMHAGRTNRHAAYVENTVKQLPELFNRWANTDSDVMTMRGGFMQMIKDLVKSSPDARTSLGESPILTADKPVPWDSLSRRSLVEIIPGFLSRILQSSESIRAGFKFEQAAPMMKYNLDSGGFSTLKTASNDAKKRLFNENALFALHGSLKEATDLVDDGSMSKTLRERFMKQLMTDTQNLVPIDEQYFSDEALGQKYSKKDAKRIRAAFQKQFSGKDGRMDPTKMSKFIDKAHSVRSNYIDPFEAAQAYLESGGRDELLQMGLINENNEIDRDAVNRIIMKDSGVEKKKKNDKTFFTDFMERSNSRWEKTADSIADRIHDNRLYQATTRKIGDVTGKVYDKVKSWFVGDVYDADDMSTPVITEAGIKAGAYRDQITGEVITDLSDITGPVIDKDGNVVLTVEQMQSRTVQRDGKVIVAFRNLGSRLSKSLKRGRRVTRAAMRKAKAEGEQAGNEARRINATASDGKHEPADVYVYGEMKEPVLYKLKMLKGMYVDAVNGKIIESVDDVAGAVKDIETGNFVITQDDYRTKGVIDANGNKNKNTIGKRLSKLAGRVAGVMSKIMTAMTSPITAAKALAGMAFAGVRSLFTGRAKPEQDVYVKGKLDRPALLWKKMVAGEYVSAKSGRLIRTADDVDGEVIELDPATGTKRTVLTEEEAAMTLVNYRGQSLRTLKGRIMRGVRSIGSGAVNLIGRTLGIVKGKIGGFFNLKGKPVSPEEKNVEVNMSILEVLRERLVKPKKIRKGSFEERLAAKDQAAKEKEEKKNKDQEEKKSGGILGFFKGLFSRGRRGLLSLFGMGDEDEDEDGEGSDILGNVADAAMIGDALTGRRGQSPAARRRLAARRLKRMRRAGLGPKAGKYGRLGRLGRGRAGRLLARIPGMGRAGRGLARGATMAARGGAGLLRGAGRLAGPVATLAIAGMSAKEAWDIGHDETLTAGQRAEGVGGSIGGAAGGLLGGMAAGAATGAALGTIFPGIGNLIGGVVGGVVGGIAGTAAGQWIGKKAVQGWQGVKNRIKGSTNRDPLFKFRLAQYGVNVDDQPTIQKILKLEYGVQNKLFHSADDVFEAMNIDDGWFSSKSGQRKRFDTWLNKRFLVVYKAWVSAMKANQKNESDDFDTATKLEKEPKKAFIQSVYSGATSAYVEMLHPFTDGTLTEGPKEVEDAKNLAIADMDKTGFQRGLDTARSWARKINTFIPGGAFINSLADKMDARSDKAEADRLRAQQAKDGKAPGGMAAPVAGSAGTATASLPPKINRVERMSALDCIRYKSYGLAKLTNEKVEQLIKLETVMWATKVIKAESGKAVTCTISSEEAFSRYCNIFGYAPDEAPYKKVQWEGWFQNRFLPVMLTYVSGCLQINQSMNPFKSNAILKPKQSIEIAKVMLNATYSALGFNFSIWRVQNSPWIPGDPLSSDKKITDGNMLAIQKDVREETAAETTASPRPPAAASHPATPTPPKPPKPTPSPRPPVAGSAGGTVAAVDPATSDDEATRRDAAYWRAKGADPATVDTTGNRIQADQPPVANGRIRNVRGIRNNNPGNIRRSPGNTWQGRMPRENMTAAQSQESSFEVFSAPAWGIRAMCKLLLTYFERYECNTIRKIISRWAPPNENDTEAYIRSAAAAVGVGADTVINLREFQRLHPLVKTIIRKENGSQPYSDSVIKEGLRLAGVGTTGTAPLETNSNDGSVAHDSTTVATPRTPAANDRSAVPVSLRARRTTVSAPPIPAPNGFSVAGIVGRSGAPLNQSTTAVNDDVFARDAREENVPTSTQGGSARASKAAQIARTRANQRSTGYCAKYVSDALLAAGYKFQKQPSAYMYATNNILKSIGFTQVGNESPSQPGDIKVFGRTARHKHGHICIFDGRNWISDFLQRNANPYRDPVPFTTWRDTNGVGGSVAEQASDTPTTDTTLGTVPSMLAVGSGRPGSNNAGVVGQVPPMLAMRAPTANIANTNGLAQAGATGNSRDDAMYDAAVANGYSMVQASQRGRIESTSAQITQRSMSEISQQQLETQKAILEQTRRTADGVAQLVKAGGLQPPAVSAPGQQNGTTPAPSATRAASTSRPTARTISYLNQLQGQLGAGNDRTPRSPVNTVRSLMASQGK